MSHVSSCVCASETCSHDSVGKHLLLSTEGCTDGLLGLMQTHTHSPCDMRSQLTRLHIVPRSGHTLSVWAEIFLIHRSYLRHVDVLFVTWARTNEMIAFFLSSTPVLGNNAPRCLRLSELYPLLPPKASSEVCTLVKTPRGCGRQSHLCVHVFLCWLSPFSRTRPRPVYLVFVSWKKIHIGGHCAAVMSGREPCEGWWARVPDSLQAVLVKYIHLGN